MKKLLSLFTILCCIFTFASFPALAVEASAQVVSFFDNFETETDTVPDNWSVAATSIDTTATIMEENGNKYLHFTNSSQRWSSGLPSVVTKDNLMNLPLSDKPVLVKYKARMSTTNSSTVQFYMRAGIPDGASSTTEITGNNYKLVEIRRTDANSQATLRYYTSNTWPSEYADITFANGEWYEIYALADPRTSSAKYMVVDKTGAYKVFNNAKLEPQSLKTLDVIDNLSAMIMNANPGAYMDIDDVYAGYVEDYADYLPKVLSFEDTFENVAVNSAPANWIDKRGVSTIQVMEETGNKFVRVRKNAGTTGAPYVTTKDGVINIPMKDQYGKGIVVEAKMRLHNATEAYRYLLMLNAPYFATDAELEAPYNTPFFIHTNIQAYFMPGFKSSGTYATAGEWFHYRAVVIPGETQTEIRHYFNDAHLASTTIDAINLPDLFNADALYNIAFPWRSGSGKSSAATAEAYVDLDDIKVYELKNPSYEVKVTNAQGTEIENIENGEITVDAKVVNNGTGRTVDVIGALYTKVGDSWKLTETQKVVNSDGNSYLYAFAWRTGVGSLKLNVTDAPNQMIKVFVWNRTADLDGDPSAFETSLRAIPVCEPIVID